MDRPRKILIVDDSDIERRMLSSVLKKSNFEVSSLSTADNIIGDISALKPEIILLDIMMPGTSGGEALEKIREEWSAIDLPVIMLSANSDPADIVNFLRLGANDYITKPPDFDVTTMRILTHLRIRDLTKEMEIANRIATVNGMITTYNHQINNPLAIALGKMDLCKKHIPAKDYENIRHALNRIADIVKKIAKVGESEAPELESYVGNTKMMKID